MRDELLSIKRLFERDNIKQNQELRASGAGVRVFITHKQFMRMLEVIEECTAEMRS
jgi:hypothetical protein